MGEEQTSIVAVNPEEQGALEVRRQVNQMQYLMRQVLREGEHYGRVPGTGKNAKPTLFQSGAEKIAYMFHLLPSYEIKRTDYPGGHREYEVTCTLSSRDGGAVVGYGVGTCTTLESKYRYRSKWEGGQKTRHENADIADTYNTVMKMAKKRAFVDAVKSTTAASDMFTQDVEDLPAYMAQQPPAQDAQAHGPARPSDEDAALLKDATAQLVAVGYVEDEVKPYLWERYKAGGIAEARAARDSMLGAAGAQPAEPDGVAPVEPDEYEAEDIEF